MHKNILVNRPICCKKSYIQISLTTEWQRLRFSSKKSFSSTFLNFGVNSWMLTFYLDLNEIRTLEN
jgi:hypothetical protein